jgi:hypothetical protein
MQHTRPHLTGRPPSPRAEGPAAQSTEEAEGNNGGRRAGELQPCVSTPPTPRPEGPPALVHHAPRHPIIPILRIPPISLSQIPQPSKTPKTPKGQTPRTLRVRRFAAGSRTLSPPMGDTPGTPPKHAPTPEGSQNQLWKTNHSTNYLSA